MLDIRAVNIALADGKVEAEGTVALGDPKAPSRIDLRWIDLNVGRLLNGADRNPPGSALAATTGTGSVEWRVPGSSGADEALVSMEAVGAVVSGSTAIEFNIGAAGDGDDWVVEINSAGASPGDFRFHGDVDTHGSSWRDYAVHGRLSLRVPDISRSLEYLAELGIAPGSFDMATVAGSVAVDGSLGGALRALRAEGVARGRSLAVGTGPVFDMDARFALDAGGLTSGTFEARTGDRNIREGPVALVSGSVGGSWSGNVTARGVSVSLDRANLTIGGFRVARLAVQGLVTAGATSGTIEARLISPDLGVGSTPVLSGALILGGSWSGPLRRPEGSFRLSGQDLMLGGLAAQELDVEGRLTLGGVEIAVATLTQTSGGTLTMDGRYDFPSGSGSLNVEGSGLHWVRGSTRLVDGAVKAGFAGTLEDLQGGAVLEVASVDVGGEELGPLAAQASAEGAIAHIQVRLPNAGIVADARTQMANPHAFAGSCTIAEMRLAHLVAALGGTTSEDEVIQGGLAASVEFHGELGNPDALTATLEIPSADADVYGVHIGLTERLRAVLNGRHFVIEPTRLDVGNVVVQASGELRTDRPDASLMLDLNGDLHGFAPWLSFLSDSTKPPTVTGLLSGTLKLERSANGLRLTGAVESSISEVRSKEGSLADDIHLVLDLTGSRAEISRLSAARGASEIEGTASIPLNWANDWLPHGWAFAPAAPDDPARLDATVSAGIVELLDIAGVDVGDGLSGGLTVAAAVTAPEPDVRSVSGEIRIERGRIETLTEFLELGAPTLVRIKNGRVIVDTIKWRGERSRLSGRGNVDLSGDTETQIVIEIDADLRLLEGVVPGKTSGRLTGMFNLAGWSGDWRASAKTALSDGNWLLPDSRIFLSGWTGRLETVGGVAELTDVEGRVNDGTVRITGQLPLRKGESGQVKIAAQDILLSIPEGL